MPPLVAEPCNSPDGSAGVLHELGLDHDCLSLKQAEQYVVKLDQEAVGKIDSLIQKSKMNPYTLYILVHDHAHWDLSRYTTHTHTHTSDHAHWDLSRYTTHTHL